MAPITGADSGIGRAVAIAFAREGADIALSYLPEEQGDAEVPGPIWTPIQPAMKAPEDLAELGKEAPLARAGQPAELAPAYVLLASDAGSYMTGALVPVTGGTPMF